MNIISGAFQISKQAHYQKQHREIQKKAEQEQVLSIVRMLRNTHPRMGTRKLLRKIKPEMRANDLKMGRDQLFEVLRSEKMLVYPRKTRRITTIPGLWRTPNLLPGMTITQPNQVWVADITYLEVEVIRFVFLFLLMDLYSRYIVGWTVSSTLEAKGALQCLLMALQKQRKTNNTSLIHHSDHGSQYSSCKYTKKLTDNEIRSSMGEVGNCYDNIYAERVIGTLKNEYLLGDLFVNIQQIGLATMQAINAYNTDRPHLSINCVSPYEAYFDRKLQLPAIKIPEKM